jgi:hypothetical protein
LRGVFGGDDFAHETSSQFPVVSSQRKQIAAGSG